jgi:hypothetical protein
MILKAMPKKPLRPAGAATLVDMGHDFTGTRTKTTIGVGLRRIMKMNFIFIWQIF